MSWSRPFEDPITLPGTLLTLKQAADYITSLPKAEQKLEEWQTAIEALIMAAENRGPVISRIGVLRALNRHLERTFTDRKEKHQGQPQAQEGSMKVLIYVNTSKQVGDVDHLKVFANEEARKNGLRRMIPRAWRSSTRFKND